MKKKVMAFAVVAVMALMAVGCTHHTCPAYRGSTVMATSSVDAQQV